jgi:hypothetical protein
MKEVWTTLSLSQTDNSPGHIAYAKQKADMYARMERDCERQLDDAGYHNVRLKLLDGELLASYVAAKHAEEESQWLGVRHSFDAKD